MEIVNAITSKRLLRFEYDGFVRTVEPHTYGLNQNGDRMLCAFQVAGGSHSSSGGWRMFSEKGMRDTALLDQRFSGPRPEYKRGDGFFRSVIAEL